MNKYKTLENVTIGLDAVVELTPQQAEPRKHNLRPLKNGTYKVLGVISFKKGEIIGLNPAYVSKTILVKLENVDNKKDNKNTTGKQNSQDQKTNTNTETSDDKNV